VVLAVKAYLEVVLGFEPRMVNFGNVFRSKEATRAVKLVGRDASETKLLSATFETRRSGKRRGGNTDSIMVTRMIETPTGTVEMSLVPDAPSGYVDGQLVVRTDHPEVPRLTVRVRGIVHGDVIFQPQRLVFSNIEAGVEQTQMVTLSGAGDQPVEILEVGSNHPALTVSVSEAAAGSTQITVTFNGKIERDQSARLIIRTSSAEDPRIEVPVLMYRLKRQAERPPPPPKPGQSRKTPTQVD
jgi:hypothetical protein